MLIVLILNWNFRALRKGLKPSAKKIGVQKSEFFENEFEVELLDDSNFDSVLGEGKIEIFSKSSTDLKVSNQSLKEIWTNLKKTKLRYRLASELKPICMDRLEELNKRFGSKAAHLLILQDNLELLNSLLNPSLELKIPEFSTIPVETYRSWKTGEDIKGRLKPFYEKYKGRKVLLRSSAVYSEDTDNLTGAGQYTSTEAKVYDSFKDFYAAAIEVYKSLNSDLATEYRKAANIEHEEMGILVQEYSEGSRQRKSDGLGFVNSILKNVPELIDVRVQVGRSNNRKATELRPIFYKDKLLDLIPLVPFNQYLSRSSSYYPLDGFSYFPDEAWKIAVMGEVLERLFGKPVQVEFRNKYSYIDIFQVRSLPANYQERASVSFPQENEPIWIANGLGVGDLELDVLPHSKENKDKHGLVIFGSSSLGRNSSRFTAPELYLPKSGAVLILRPPHQKNGHLETICAERGILCIFSTLRPIAMSDINTETLKSLPNWRSLISSTTIESLRGHKRLRVVSSGIDARIYPSS